MDLEEALNNMSASKKRTTKCHALDQTHPLVLKTLCGITLWTYSPACFRGESLERVPVYIAEFGEKLTCPTCLAKQVLTVVKLE